MPDRASKNRLDKFRQELYSDLPNPIVRPYAPLGAKKLVEGEVVRSVSSLIRLTQYSD